MPSSCHNREVLLRPSSGIEVSEDLAPPTRTQSFGVGGGHILRLLVGTSPGRSVVSFDVFTAKTSPTTANRSWHVHQRERTKEATLAKGRPQIIRISERDRR